MKYRVSLERILPGPAIRNPFTAFRTAETFYGATCKVLVRTWELDATDEADVRRLLDEARAENVPGVQGMKLRSIERI